MSLYNFFMAAGGGGIPPAVADYQNRVAAAGGVLSPSDLNLLTVFYNTPGIPSILSKVEVGFFLGGFAGSLVKFNYLDPNYKSLLNDGGVAFISSDYAENKGMIKINTPELKRLNLGFDPTAIGATFSDFSFGIAFSDSQNALSTYGGLNPISGAVPIQINMTQIFKNNNPSGTQHMTPFPRIKGGDYFWRWVNAKNTFLNSGNDYSYFFTPDFVVSGDFQLNNYFTLFLSGGATSSVASIAFYFCGKGLTLDERELLQRSAEIVMVGKGRKATTKQSVTIGDSITQGVSPSVYTNRYSYILANSFGLMEKNCGINGSQLRINNGNIPGGYPRRQILANYNIGKLVMAYGVNDMTIADATANGDPTILADYQAKYEAMVDYAVTLGVSLSDIYVCSPSFINNGTSALKQESYRDKAKAAAQSRHCKFVDNYQYLLDNGGGSNLIADNIHPNDTGHANIAFNIFNNAIQY